MPAEAKIPVVTTLGDGDSHGRIDPKVGMVVDKGTITAVGTEFVTVSGQGVGTPSQFYPGELFITVTEAQNGFSWPSGDGSIVFGHRALFASGVPKGSHSTVVLLYPNGQLVNHQR